MVVLITQFFIFFPSAPFSYVQSHIVYLSPDPFTYLLIKSIVIRTILNNVCIHINIVFIYIYGV